MSINCFDRWLPELSSKFKDRVTEGMSGDEQREVAKNIALEYHKQLHDELNGVRGKIGLKKEPYVSPENTTKIKEINDHYDNLINEIKSKQNSTEAKPIIKPSKPISEMNSDELYKYATDTKKALKKQDAEFDGKTEKEKENGGYYDTIDNVEDLRDASQRVNLVENSENKDQLASSIKSILSNIKKGNPSEYDKAVLNAAKNKAAEMGIDVTDLIKTVISKVGEQYKDKDDAAFMMQNAFDKLTNKTKQNAIPKQEAGNVGVRNETTVRPEMGSDDQSGESTGQGNGQPPTEESKATGEEENDVTSIRNAIVEDKINSAGLKPVEDQAARDFGTVWGEAKEKIAKGYDVKGLIDELKKKPRSLTDVEDAMLLHYQNTKEAQLSETTNAINNASETGNKQELEENKVQRARILDDLQDVYNVGKSAGRETARGLNARKMMVDRKYSLVNMLAEKRAANGGEPLTPEQEKSVNAKFEEIKKTNEELANRVGELEKQVSQLKSGGKTIAQKGKALADQIRKFKTNHGNTLQANLFGLPEAVYNGALETIATSVEQGAKLIDAINKGLDNVKFKNDKDKHDFINHFSAFDKPTEAPNLLNPEIRKAEANRQRAINDFESELKKDEQKKQPLRDRALSTFVKWQRGFKLTSPITLGKLTAAALTRLTTEPLEEGVGAIISKAIPKLAKQAEGQGGVNIKALVKGYKAAITQGMKDSATILHGGKGRSDLDVLFGKKGELPPEAIDFFGQLHSALKAPVKRFAFERALEKRLTNNAKNGVDISDPLVVQRIMTDAYKDANRAIFMQDNKVAEGWQRMVSSLDQHEGTKPVAAAMQWLLPFVKVPTNIIAEAARTTPAGFLSGAGKLVHTYFTKGVENLSSDEADMIMRNLKKGSLGTAAMLLGYFNPNHFGGFYDKDREKKKGEGDIASGHAKIFGATIPTWMLESPIFQAMQLGATMRRVKDEKVKGDTKGIGEGIWAGATGMLKEEPLVDQPSRLYEAFDPKQRDYYFDELGKSIVEPAVLQNVAQWTDPADKRPMLEKIFDPKNVRSPKNFEEHLKAGIPGLRETVPLKNKGKKEAKALADQKIREENQ